MKLELSEKFYVDELFRASLEQKKIAIKSKAFEVKRLTGDASTRRYYRIKTSEVTFVVCLDNPVEAGKKSPFLQVQKALFENKVSVPEIYDFNLSKGFYLEEDLGDMTFLRKLAEIDSVESEYLLYSRIVDELIKIHIIDQQAYEKETFTSLCFDFKKLQEEINFASSNFIEKFLGQNHDSKELLNISLGFEKICLKLSEQERVLTHRDFHSRNVMIKENKLFIIDFQDARMGIPQYDLVSMLEDCYYKISCSNKDKLKKYYWDKFLSKKKIQASYKEFEKLYDYMAIQRIFKALGTFSYIYHSRGDVRYLKYIGHGFENLKSFLLKHDELNSLRVSLSKIYYEN